MKIQARATGSFYYILWLRGELSVKTDGQYDGMTDRHDGPIKGKTE